MQIMQVDTSRGLLPKVDTKLGFDAQLNGVLKDHPLGLYDQTTHDLSSFSFATKDSIRCREMTSSSL